VFIGREQLARPLDLFGALRENQVDRQPAQCGEVNVQEIDHHTFVLDAEVLCETCCRGRTHLSHLS